MKLTKSLYFLTFFYISVAIWWVFLFLSGQKDSFNNYSFVFIYGLLPLMGGIFGIVEAKKWGLFRSALGKALFFLSLGLITWSGGETIWSYYNLILHVEIPYPSWADASFIISWPLWSLGVFYLSAATGAKFGLKKAHGKLLLLLIPIISIIFSYYLLVVVARQGSFEIAGGPVKIFFDLAYPVWDVIILTLALLVYGLSFKFLGGRFKWPVIIILFGFIINYFADFGFSYTTTVESYFNGNWVDLLFATAMFILSFGINSINTKNT
ncbi:hypothetical protein A2767_01790 [Candidatus Roizmanbacteria bacterium RIFCSPHIGHO2_01_FULL_35_10]|uniref:Histidine kinase N-terminal 7TM region domain-containing protein n=1 Tax=Candidatus Roizmanbacteria bacterium RIFCSPLOWO2_01_FULL_35_13 TaxID=1802055 RepID=A0A1F7I9Q9_9BACT|nr:MAG: hypothetical protein A2767_01790 [Candidatus Roizmanbacteria bacterium RIFCSPHIGHO2_01_FULL_35_10]OGK40095.1 MAG: hypothetical protein A3A74_02735 [Candidatus Roizmanbacteria bacterium RIFCSPLOWO2_01_FULL_35_13]